MKAVLVALLALSPIAQTRWRLPVTVEVFQDVPAQVEGKDGQRRGVLYVDRGQVFTVKKGQRFLMVKLGQEGGCRIEFEKKQYEVASCPWLDGFRDHQEDIFTVVAGRPPDQTPAEPDFSGPWILESAEQPSNDIPKTLVVRQSLVLTNVYGQPMQPFFRNFTVTREFATGPRTETHLIGVVGGTVAGIGGTVSTRVPSSHHRVFWEGRTLIVINRTFTGPEPQTGEWADRREEWSFASDRRLQLVIVASDSRGGSTNVSLTYRRQ